MKNLEKRLTVSAAVLYRRELGRQLGETCATEIQRGFATDSKARHKFYPLTIRNCF